MNIQGETRFFKTVNGKKVEVSKEEINQIADATNSSISSSKILTSQEDLSKYVNKDFGILSPEWYAQTSTSDASSVTQGIYNGADGKVYLNLNNAIDSYMNAGNEVYFFNNIYFRNKTDLRDYLNNLYFKDTKNSSLSKGFRIKAPNGQLSDLIRVGSNEAEWQDKAASFIENNAQVMIKIKKHDGSIKLLKGNSVEEIAKGLSVEDVPYVNVKSNDGKKTWLVGLNSADKYDWSGPSFYYGYNDLSGMENKAKWNRREGGIISNVEDQVRTIQWQWLNQFFADKVSLGDVQTLKVNTEKETTVNVSKESHLFRDAQNTTTKNSAMTIAEELSAKTIKDNLKGRTGDAYGPFFKEKTIDFDGVEYELSSFTRDMADTVPVNPILRLSMGLRDRFAGKNLEWIYDEAVQLANEYRVSKDFNILLKIPLTYNFIMDKLVSVAADADLINLTVLYFAQITSIFQWIITVNLGPSVLIPSQKYKSEGNLDLVKIFGISTDDLRNGATKASVDFNIEKFYQYLPEAYPSLFAAVSCQSFMSSMYNSGLAITDELQSKLIDLILGTEFKDITGNDYTDVRNNLNAMFDWYRNDRAKLLDSQYFVEKACQSDIAYSVYISLLNSVNQIDTRDNIADHVVSELGELLSAGNDWDLVPNDNEFKTAAYFLNKVKKLNVVPNDFVNSVDLWNPDTLVGLSNAIQEINYELATNPAYENILEVVNSKLGTPDVTDKKTSSYIDNLKDFGTKKNKQMVGMLDTAINDGVSVNSRLNFVPFSGAQLTFNEYFAITTMRMFGDIAEYGTLFVFDDDNGTWVINPLYKVKATQIVSHLLNNKEYKQFQQDMLLLYRGWQNIQDSISMDESYMRYRTGESELAFSPITTREILKHTAQYSAVLNKNILGFEELLKNIGIQEFKSGKVIAYSGTTSTYAKDSNHSDFNYVSPNHGKTIDIYGAKDTDDIATFAPNIETKTNLFVTPNISFDNEGAFRYSQIDESIYVMPVNLMRSKEFGILNKVEYTFEKFLDIAQLPSLGIIKEMSVKTNEGRHYYFNPNLISATASENYYGRIPVKKWGDVRINRIDSKAESSYVNDLTQYSLHPSQNFSELAIVDGAYLSGTYNKEKENDVGYFPGADGVFESKLANIINKKYAPDMKTQYYYYDRSQKLNQYDNKKRIDNYQDSVLNNCLQEYAIAYNNIEVVNKDLYKTTKNIENKVQDQVNIVNTLRVYSDHSLLMVTNTLSGTPIVLATPDQIVEIVSERFSDEEKIKGVPGILRQELINIAGDNIDIDHQYNLDTQIELYVHYELAATYYHERIQSALDNFGYKAFDIESCYDVDDIIEQSSYINIPLELDFNVFQTYVDNQTYDMDLTDTENLIGTRKSWIYSFLHSHSTEFNLTEDEVQDILDNSPTSKQIIETGVVPQKLEDYDESWQKFINREVNFVNSRINNEFFKEVPNLVKYDEKTAKNVAAQIASNSHLLQPARFPYNTAISGMHLQDIQNVAPAAFSAEEDQLNVASEDFVVKTFAEESDSELNFPTKPKVHFTEDTYLKDGRKGAKKWDNPILARKIRRETRKYIKERDSLSTNEYVRNIGKWNEQFDYYPNVNRNNYLNPIGIPLESASNMHKRFLDSRIEVGTRWFNDIDSEYGSTQIAEQIAKFNLKSHNNRLFAPTDNEALFGLLFNYNKNAGVADGVANAYYNGIQFDRGNAYVFEGELIFRNEDSAFAEQFYNNLYKTIDTELNDINSWFLTPEDPKKYGDRYEELKGNYEELLKLVDEYNEYVDRHGPWHSLSLDQNFIDRKTKELRSKRDLVVSQQGKVNGLLRGWNYVGKYEQLLLKYRSQFAQSYAAATNTTVDAIESSRPRLSKGFHKGFRYAKNNARSFVLNETPAPGEVDIGYIKDHWYGEFGSDGDIHPVPTKTKFELKSTNYGDWSAPKTSPGNERWVLNQIHENPYIPNDLVGGRVHVSDKRSAYVNSIKQTENIIKRIDYRSSATTSSFAAGLQQTEVDSLKTLFVAPKKNKNVSFKNVKTEKRVPQWCDGYAVPAEFGNAYTPVDERIVSNPGFPEWWRVSIDFKKKILFDRPFVWEISGHWAYIDTRHKAIYLGNKKGEWVPVKNLPYPLYSRIERSYKVSYHKPKFDPVFNPKTPALEPPSMRLNYNNMPHLRPKRWAGEDFVPQIPTEEEVVDVSNDKPIWGRQPQAEIPDWSNDNPNDDGEPSHGTDGDNSSNDTNSSNPQPDTNGSEEHIPGRPHVGTNETPDSNPSESRPGTSTRPPEPSAPDTTSFSKVAPKVTSFSNPERPTRVTLHEEPAPALSENVNLLGASADMDRIYADVQSEQIISRERAMNDEMRLELANETREFWQAAGSTQVEDPHLVTLEPSAPTLEQIELQETKNAIMKSKIEATKVNEVELAKRASQSYHEKIQLTQKLADAAPIPSAPLMRSPDSAEMSGKKANVEVSKLDNANGAIKTAIAKNKANIAAGRSNAAMTVGNLFSSIGGVFGPILNAFNYVMGFVGFAMMVWALVEACTMRDTPVSYTYNAGDASWSWSGGYETKNAIGAHIAIRSVGDMQLNTPMAINEAHVRDFKYYNGKQYTNDEELVQQYAQDIYNQINGISSPSSIGFYIPYLTFDNQDEIIAKFDDSIPSLKQGLYTDMAALLDTIMGEMVADHNASKYTTDTVYSYSDQFFGDWSSVQNDAMIESASNSIIEKIRPTYVAMTPVLNNQQRAVSRRNFILPGTSYNSITHKLESPKEKGIDDSFFIINNEANDLVEGSTNQFAYSYAEATKKARDKNIAAARDFIQTTLISTNVLINSTTMIDGKSYNDFVNDSSTKSLIDVLTLNRKGKTPLYFVATTVNGVTHSARDNLNAYLKSELNIEAEYSNNVQVYYVYKGKTYKSYQEVVNAYDDIKPEGLN